MSGVVSGGASVEVPSSESCVGSGRISVLFSFVDVSSTSSSPKSTSSSSPNSISSKPFLGLSNVLSTSCSVICLASASLEASRSPCLATSAKLDIVQTSTILIYPNLDLKYKQRTFLKAINLNIIPYFLHLRPSCEKLFPIS